MVRKPFFQKFIAVLAALALWQVAATALDLKILLASPLEVLARLLTIWREADFWQTILYSLSRIALGFLLAFVLGILLAIAAGRFRAVEMLLWPYVTCIKTVPVASFIIISLVLMDSSQLSTFISFLMVFPVIYSNVLEGIHATDHELMEMAQVSRIPWGKRLIYIHLPQVRPFLLSACSVALGMAWKSGIAAEVIAVADGSIGEKLYESKVYFLTADLFSWTIVIVLLSVLFEKLVLLILKQCYKGLAKL